jgi:hypothetical protein
LGSDAPTDPSQILKVQHYVRHLTTKPREERATSELSRPDRKQGHGNNPYD